MASPRALKTPFTDGISYVTHVQTVYLKAADPSIFQVLPYWFVSSTEGSLPAISPKENELYLESLPDRIATVSMLHHSLSRLIIASLLLAWTFALSYRLRRIDSKMKQLILCVAVLIILLCAWFDWLGGYAFVLAAYYAWDVSNSDALAVLLAFVLARGGWIITAIGLTAAHTTGAMTASVTDPLLPFYDAFIAKLRPAPPTTCPSCWSTANTPLRMPCHRNHVFCQQCLSRWHANGENFCPHCFKTLYVISRFRECKALFRYYIVTNLIAAAAFSFPTLALQLYKGYHDFAFNTIKVLAGIGLSSGWCWLKLRKEERLVENHILFLAAVFFISAVGVVFSAFELRKWDQVTLWDGVVLEGVNVWNTYPVVREQYGPVEWL